MADSKPRFKRQESWRLKRVKENWRRPRGVTSRMRKEKKGWPQKVKVGYGTEVSRRGLHPTGLVERFVRTESDLEGLDPKIHIVRLSGQVGEKKRLILLGRVRTLNVHVANPGKEEARPVSGEKPTTRTRAQPEPSEMENPDESQREGEALAEEPASMEDAGMEEEALSPEETDQ